MTDEQLRARVAGSRPRAPTTSCSRPPSRSTSTASIAELFGKDEGYCRGRGGGMHIGDFSTGHLGANAIVGGGVPIATGAAMAHRYEQTDKVVCCFAGDGAYANGVVLESLNWAAQAPVDQPPGRRPAVRPADHLLHPEQPLRDDPPHRRRGHGRPPPRPAGRRVRDQQHARRGRQRHGRARRARRGHAGGGALPRGRGPGPDRGEHVPLLRPLALATRATSTAPARRRRPGRPSTRSRTSRPARRGRRRRREAGVAAVEQRRPRAQRARSQARASHATDPTPRALLDYLYTDTHERRRAGRGELGRPATRRPPVAKPTPRARSPTATRSARRSSRRWRRDSRVIFYGEDVADYGGAFKLTKGLLEAFGRDRVFNTPISEACICGTAVGAAIARPAAGGRADVHGLRADGLGPDRQPGREVALHERRPGRGPARRSAARSGAGKGYGGQHSQTLESLFTPHPGIWVVYPATAADAKGLLKSRDPRRTTRSCSSRARACTARRASCPTASTIVEPIGVARIAREGTDVTIVAWGPRCSTRSRPPTASRPRTARRPRSSTCAASSRSTWRRCSPRCARPAAAWSPARRSCRARSSTRSSPGSRPRRSTTSTRRSARIGAKAGISPQADSLEQAFLPDADDIYRPPSRRSSERRTAGRTRPHGSRRSSCPSPAR